MTTRRAATTARKPSRKGGPGLRKVSLRSRALQAGVVSLQFTANKPIHKMFIKRVGSALQRIMEHADDAALAEAVTAPTDEGVLARAVSDNVPVTPAVSDLDPLAALIAKGAELKIELLEKAGGGLPVGEVAKLLRISRQAVDKRRRERKLLAVARGRDHLYPACQFLDDDVVPGLPDVLAFYGPERGWGALSFLITPNEQLNDLSPLDALKGGDPKLRAMTIRLARAADSDGFG